MEDIGFDDIAKLKSKISDTFGGWSDPVEVTQDMINRFAELTGRSPVDPRRRRACEAREPVQAEPSRTAS